MNELALFAGTGGGILGGKLLGWRTVCAVEIDAYCASVLMARQNEGHLPPFPIWDDVSTFDGYPWQGIVDVVSGGFPCQDISAANANAKGIEGERSGLWKEFARIVREVRPRYVFVENSPMLTSRGLGVVLGDLAEMGFDARWGVLGAIDVGAPHRRDRIWIVANSCCKRPRENARGIHENESKHEGRSEEHNHKSGGCGEDVFNTTIKRFPNWSNETMEQQTKDKKPKRSNWWATEPKLGRVAHGVAHRVDRLKAIGNGQVPLVAKIAWEILSD